MRAVTKLKKKKICMFLWISMCGWRACEGTHQYGWADNVYLLWWSHLLLWLSADCHHGASYLQGRDKGWLMAVLSVSCFLSIFLVLPFPPLLFHSLCPQRTWMTCGWRVWRGWLHPAVSSARDAAPISLNHRPKLHSTSALGVPGKCFHLLLSGPLNISRVDQFSWEFKGVVWHFFQKKHKTHLLSSQDSNWLIDTTFIAVCFA